MHSFIHSFLTFLTYPLFILVPRPRLVSNYYYILFYFLSPPTATFLILFLGVARRLRVFGSVRFGRVLLLLLLLSLLEEEEMSLPPSLPPCVVAWVGGCLWLYSEEKRREEICGLPCLGIV